LFEVNFADSLFLLLLIFLLSLLFVEGLYRVASGELTLLFSSSSFLRPSLLLHTSLDLLLQRLFLLLRLLRRCCSIFFLLLFALRLSAILLLPLFAFALLPPLTQQVVLLRPLDNRDNIIPIKLRERLIEVEVVFSPSFFLAAVRGRMVVFVLLLLAVFAVLLVVVRRVVFFAENRAIVGFELAVLVFPLKSRVGTVVVVCERLVRPRVLLVFLLAVLVLNSLSLLCSNLDALVLLNRSLLDAPRRLNVRRQRIEARREATLRIDPGVEATGKTAAEVDPVEIKEGDLGGVNVVL
jgi:hypothetical protein